jgi:hypothetical protein
MNNAHAQNFNTAQTRHHSIFSPQIINSPLPTTIYSPCPNSICLPTPIPATQAANIFSPQPVDPNLQFPSDSSPLMNSNHLSQTSYSSGSHQNIISQSTLKFSLPNTKDIPLLTGEHNWGPWHSAVSSLVLCSNLLSHIADDLLPGAAYDPDLWPTYLPVL